MLITDDILFIAGSILVMLLHQILWRKGAFERMPLLNLTAFLPMVLWGVSLALDGYEKCLLPAYLAGVLYTLCFAGKTAKEYLPAAVLSAVLTVGSVLPCAVSDSYRLPTYTQEFDAMFSLMRKHYVLTDYKQTDWDAIYDKYYPQVKALGRDSDSDYEDICYLMANEFRDCHVQIFPEAVMHDEKAVRRVTERICGGDPGFSAVRLDDGRILACCVDEESDAYKAGMRNGSELLSYNGVEINEFVDSTEPVFTSFSDIDNLNFYRPVAAFGMDGNTAEVSFRNSDGEEVTAQLTASGRYIYRIEAVDKALNGSDDQYNMTWRDLGNDTACLVLGDFMTDPAIRDEDFNDTLKELVENESCDYPLVKLVMDKNIKEMKEAGITKLIIDMRRNGGGDAAECGFVASYFCKEELFLAAEEYTDSKTGEKIITDPITSVAGEDPWQGEIVILVGSRTASAAEIFTRAMSTQPNVTVMGVNDSAGVAMAVCSCSFGKLAATFPVLRMVDENGDILIDSDTDMQGGLDIDIKLPMDKQAFDEMFIDNKDYVLEKARAFLNE